jgi:outer membrane protein
MKTKISVLMLILVMGIAAHAQKFAFIDTQYILENISEYRNAQETLDKISIDWQKEIEEKFGEVDKLYKAFQTEAPLLPEEMKKKKEEEIIKKEREAKELQKKRFGKDGDLFKKRQELIKPIQDKVYDAIEDIAQAQGFAVIFDKAGSATLIYSNPRFDKSDDVLDKLGYKPGAIPSKGRGDSKSDSDED